MPEPTEGQARQLARSRGVRERRLKRMVARSRLALIRQTMEHREGVGEALGMLRTIVESGTVDLSEIEVGPEGVDERSIRGLEKRMSREARLAAGDILHHFREMEKMEIAREKDPARGDTTNIQINVGPVQEAKPSERVVEVEDAEDAG